MSPEDKNNLRKHFRQLRQQLSEESRTSFSKLAMQHLVKQACFQKSQHIACYVKVKSEMDVMPLMEIIWQTGKQCYLPVVSDQNDLKFLHYASSDQLILTQYGILEPMTSNQVIDINELDIVITPLVAFDHNGHRLGAGGGYYDKTFATKVSHPLRVGWAYAIQEAEQLPHDDWDVDLHAVVTEKEFKLF